MSSLLLVYCVSTHNKHTTSGSAEEAEAFSPEVLAGWRPREELTTRDDRISRYILYTTATGILEVNS